jgi:hypothetical protein
MFGRVNKGRTFPIRTKVKRIMRTGSISFSHTSRLIAVTALCMGLGHAALAGPNEAAAAYKKGDYATAMSEWQDLADLGFASAQYHVGIMYLKGQGVKVDQKKAAGFIKRRQGRICTGTACAGNPVSQGPRRGPRQCAIPYLAQSGGRARTQGKPKNSRPTIQTLASGFTQRRPIALGRINRLPTHRARRST